MYPDPRRKRIFGWTDLIIFGLLVLLVLYVKFRVSDVLVYKWQWSQVSDYLLIQDSETSHWRINILLEGFLTTIRVSIWAMIFAVTIGLAIGVMRASTNLLARLISGTYVGLIRNIPPLVFIFVFYFFISSQIIPVLGIDTWARELDSEGRSLMGALIGPPEILENLISGIICLAMFEAAYIAEITRAGIHSVPYEQTEAAKSLGLNKILTFFLIILPQAVKSMLPPLANQFIMLIKDSAIISLISVQELTFLGAEISVSSGRRFEIWIVVAVLYFILCYSLALFFRHLENRSRLGSH